MSKNKSFKIIINGVLYKSINSPMTKKVISYVDLGCGNFVNNEEWDKEINNLDELKTFAELEESRY